MTSFFKINKNFIFTTRKRKNKLTMKKTTYILISLALVLSLTVAVINSQGGGLGYQPCQTNQDCRSGYCRGGRCGTATCRNDKACLKAGLYDHYCRRRGPKIFRSECVPKRGFKTLLKSLELLIITSSFLYLRQRAKM